MIISDRGHLNSQNKSIGNNAKICIFDFEIVTSDRGHIIFHLKPNHYYLFGSLLNHIILFIYLFFFNHKIEKSIDSNEIIMCNSTQDGDLILVKER